MTATIPAPDVVPAPDTSAPWFDPRPLPPGKKARPPKPPKAARPPRPVRAEREPRSRRRGRFSSPHALPEIGLLALALFVGYTVFAWWLKYPFHYAIGDSLARTADAKFMLFSRDPHAAAIGVYWMPFPTFSELPFMEICERFHHPEFAGPLSTAMWGALTVLILGRIARDVGVSRSLGFIVCVLYALDPVIVFYAGNGMSEGAEFFFTAVVLWGLALIATRELSLRGRAICGIGLAGLIFSKYEAAPAVFVVAGTIILFNFAELRRRVWKPTLVDLLLTTGPAIVTGVLWLLYMQIITGSWKSFLTVGQVTATASGGTTSVVMAAESNLVATATFVLHYAVGFGFGLVGLVLLVRTRSYRVGVLALGTLGLAVSLIIATSEKVYVGGTFGNPRYFTPVVVTGAVAVLLGAGLGRSQKSGVSRLVGAGIARENILVRLIVIALLVAAGVDSVRLERGNTDSVEHEDRVFNVLYGKYDIKSGTGDDAATDRQAAQQMDSLLRPGQRVVLDTRFENGVALYTRHLNQFIITSDRDYERIVAPDGVPTRIDWAVTYPAGSTLSSAAGNDEAGELVARQQGWTMVWTNRSASIWRRDPKLVQQEAALAPHNH